MRKLLTGVCNNIVQNIDKIKLWENSFNKVSEGDVVLIAYNPTPDDIKALKECGIMYVIIAEHSSETVNNTRLTILSDFFRHLGKHYDIALSTDVFDVAFTRDPFKKLDLEKYDIFVAGEGVSHGEEPWNMDVMNKCFPQYNESVRSQEVFCSGVIAGKPLQLSQWYLDMVKISLISKKGHDIEDQAIMNIMINQNEKYRLKKFNLKDNWAIHLATGGPTQFFEQWGFKARIMDRYGIVPDWEDYDIVHQFNRIPEIQNHLLEIYD